MHWMKAKLKMNVSSLESVHDLIFITDYHTPNKMVYNTVTSVLNTLNIFWFQGPHDGRIYVTRDALMYVLEDGFYIQRLLNESG